MSSDGKVHYSVVVFLIILKFLTLSLTETHDHKWNISETPAPSDGSEGRIPYSMSSAILFFIGSITTVFFGGAFIFFSKEVEITLFYHCLIVYSYQC